MRDVLRSRWLPATIAVIAASVMVVSLLLRDGSGSDDRAETQAYAQTIEELAKQGGRVVVEEIRPRLAELVAHDVEPEQFRTDAVRWRREMERVRRQFRTTEPPEQLRRAAELFDLALRQYVIAIEGFVRASRQSDLSAAITAATPLAERADRTYDEADALVQAELARLGLPTRPSVP